MSAPLTSLCYSAATMPLAPGSKLSQFEILAPIGAGGMGEVYRALDSTLKREVAIKLLPPEFTSDSERIARFKREAQLLAALNHPNIATIHGLHSHPSSEGPQYFLVMELVAGEDLSQHIRRDGAVPLDETLTIATQICDALEHAHEHGVIHRDLKPANVKVTPEGKVKVLDFGLAKAFAGDSTATKEASPGKGGYYPDSQTPTLAPQLTASPTIPGAILGTAAYMSPEQARGKEVDKRTDIWALGCVLYELLTGRQVFTGESTAEILGALQHKEPDWSLLPAETPLGIRALLRRCLQKDRTKRLASAGDLAIQIQDAAAGASLESAQAGTVATTEKAALVAEKTSLETSVRRGRKQARIAWAVAAALAIITGIAAWMLKPSPVQQHPVTRLALTLPPGQHLAALDQPAIAISPDGKKLVYVAVQDNLVGQASGLPAGGQAGGLSLPAAQQLYLRPLDSNESKLITGTEGATGPFFSPDGQWIGFFAGGKLKKVSVNSGATITLASASQPGGAAWSSLGTLALQPLNAAQGLQEVSQEGGALQPLTRLGKGESYQRWPEFLPNGQGVLLAGSPTSGSWNNAQIDVQPVGTGTPGEPKSLAQGSQPRYTASGHLLYAQAGTLMAAPFNALQLALSGAAVPAIEDVMQSNSTGAAQYSLSSTGTLAYLAGGVAGNQSRIVWVSRNGEEQTLPAVPHSYQFPRVSPDGSRVAVLIADQESQVWVYDISRDTLTRLTFEGNVNSVPAWSPDGKRITFSSNRAGPLNLFWQAADGSGTAERLTTSDYINSPNSFSPDGHLLTYMENNQQTGRDIWVLNLKDPGTPGQARKAQPFLKTPYEESAPKFSPDGKWLAYSSDESGRREIYVQAYPGPGGKWQISTEGGQEPVWNPKGGELFYRSGSKIMAVDVQVGQASDLPSGGQAGGLSPPGFTAGKPQVLFDGPYLPNPGSLPWYDVSPDGQRFLMLKPVDSQATAPTQINIVLNWFEELKAKVPLAR